MKTATACYDADFEELAFSKDDKGSQWVSRNIRAIGRSVKGVAASFGTGGGSAVLVTDPGNPLSFAGIPEDAVLVCRTAHPNLTMIIPRINALVVESGGMLSCVAGAARDNAIPAVMDATGLIDMINEGDIVRVNGRNGVVEVIRKRSGR